MAKKYLDNTGLSHLWSIILEKLASKPGKDVTDSLAATDEELFGVTDSLQQTDIAIMENVSEVETDILLLEERIDQIAPGASTGLVTERVDAPDGAVGRWITYGID